MLRAVRFAGRFGFAVAADLRAAASDPTVRSDLLNKVSRERYGIELNKMLSGVCFCCCVLPVLSVCGCSLTLVLC